VKHWKEILIGAAILALFVVSEVRGQGVCSDHKAMTARMAMTYGEIHIITLPKSAKHYIELWASPKTGSWTLLQVDTVGQACVISSGNDAIIPYTRGYPGQIKAES